MTKSHRLSKIALSLSCFMLSATAMASAVRGDIDYQHFRDFAENRGLFSIGATNLPIYKTNGDLAGIMLEGVPMPNLSAVDSTGGVSTLFDYQHIASVAHNGGYARVSFGDFYSNPKSQSYYYNIVDRNNFFKGKDNLWEGKNISDRNADYHTPRLAKMVTEATPLEFIDDPTFQGNHVENSKIFVNSDRYTYFVRSGSGTQDVVTKNEDGTFTTTNLAPAYEYQTGGGIFKVNWVSDIEIWAVGKSLINGKWHTGKPNTMFDNHYGPMTTFGLPGDSGSGLIAWDAQEKKWKLAAVLNFLTGYGNLWGFSRASFNEYARNKVVAGSVNTDGAVNLEWNLTDSNEKTNKSSNITLSTGSQDTNGTALTGSQIFLKRTALNEAPRATYKDEAVESLQVDLRDPTQVNSKGQVTMAGLDHGKNVYFNNKGSQATVLTLNNSINQGAGSLYFSGNHTVKSKTGEQTWVGGGIYTAPQAQVTWQVKGVKGDRLSKVGQGTLIVNATGVNDGDISVGEGTVVLDQQADSQGRKQAFNSLAIVSGRPTVVLKTPDSIEMNRIYFGTGGGRLDLDGNRIEVLTINNYDAGAQIVNHNKDRKATLAYFIHPKEYYTRESNNELEDAPFYYFDNNFFIKEMREVSYYIPKVPLAARKDMKPGQYQFPFWGQETDTWHFLGNDKAKAKELAKDYKQFYHEMFVGFIGENDPNRHNGQLDIYMDPEATTTKLILNGGMNLNGNIDVTRGNLFLTGAGVEHAYDVLKRQEVYYDWDWHNRDFKLKDLNLGAGANLTIGRNVNSVTLDNLNLKENASATLGYLPNQESCYRTVKTTAMVCGTELSEKAQQLMPTTLLSANITADTTANVHFGKLHLVGSINGNVATTMANNSVWTLTKDSAVGNLTLSKGSRIILGDLTGEIPMVTSDQAANNSASNSETSTTAAVVATNSSTSNGVTETSPSSRELTLSPSSREQNSVTTPTAATATPITPENSYASLNKLTINGDLSGEGRFDFRLNSKTQQVDKVVVTGTATGTYDLALHSLSTEAQADNKAIELFNFSKTNTNNVTINLLGNDYVDIGTYRYHLEKNNGNIVLVAPVVREDEEKAQQLEAERLRLEQEAAAKAAEEARLAKEEQERQQQAEQEAQRQAQLAQEEEAKRQALLAQEEEARRQALAQADLEEQARKAKEEHERRKQEAIAHAKEVAEQARLAAQQAKKEAQQAAQLAEERKQAQIQAAALAQEAALKAQQAAQEAQRLQQQADKAEQAAKALALAEKAAQEAKASSTNALLAAQQAREAELKLQQAQLASVEKSREAEAATLNALNLGAVLSTDTNDGITITNNGSANNSVNANLVTPTQASYLSTYANAVVSDVHAQMGMVSQLDQAFTGNLLNLDSSSNNSWVKARYYNTSYGSDLFRDFSQKNNTIEIGGATKANDMGLSLGFVLSQATATNSLNEGATSNSKLINGNAFAKVQLNEQAYLTADVGYGNFSNELTVPTTLTSLTTKFNRDFTSLGFGAGANLNLAGVEVKGLTGLRGTNLGRVDYNLGQMQLQANKHNLVYFYSTLALSKQFNLGAATVKPYLAVSYAENLNKKFSDKLFANGVALELKAGCNMTYTTGVELNLSKAIAVTGQYSYNKATNAKASHQAELKLNYKF